MKNQAYQILEKDILTKKVKTSFDESEIQVLRDRQATFNPMIVQKDKI